MLVNKRVENEKSHMVAACDNPHNRRHGLLLSGVAGAVLVSALVMSVQPAQAAKFDTDSDWVLTWDNLVKYTGAIRTSQQDGQFLNSVFVDDGDRNFKAGDLVLDRFDLVSQFGASYHQYGFLGSFSAYYDPTYAASNARNTNQTTYDGNGSSTKYTNETVVRNGKNILLGDAFVYGKNDVYEDHTVSWRLGRYAQQWGETLFMGTNGIAGGMAPIDINKAELDPTIQFKELILPVTQAGATVNLGSGFSTAFYYQFEWRPNLFPGDGAYFATPDFNYGAENFIVTSAGKGYQRGKDFDPRHGGQYGVNLKYSDPDGNADYGLYFINYSDKSATNVITDGVLGSGGVSIFGGTEGVFHSVYAQDIRDLAASYSTIVYGQQVGFEASETMHAPLFSNNVCINAVALGCTATSQDNDWNPAYAVGNVFHYNINETTFLKRTALWEGGTLLFEYGGEQLTEITKNPGVFSYTGTTNNRGKVANGLQTVFAPQWYQVLPGADLTGTLGFTYNILGRSPDMAGGFNNAGLSESGSISIGAELDIRSIYKTRLQYTYYLGQAGYNFVSDRDFLSWSLLAQF